MKNTLLFLTGLSGSGKGYFFDNFLPRGRFYRLVSATTRKARDSEQEGREYYFRDQCFFDSERFATYLFVNQNFYKTGGEKWLYGVSEQEIKSNLGKDLVYDVIQPMYIRQMIDWFQGQKINGYEFRVAYFLPPQDNFQIAEKRAMMKNDLDVRKTNTCDPIDFLRAGVQPDWFVKCSAAETIIPKSLCDFIGPKFPDVAKQL